MRNVITTLLIIFSCKLILGQPPQAIPYQAVARNNQGQPLANKSINVRFSVIDSIATGNTVYQESHSATTSNLGLFNLNVGMGTVVTGSFSGINWGVNSKFLKAELDTTASGSSFVDLGTQQMLSVPYALYTEEINIRVAYYGDTLFIGKNNFVIIPGLSSANPNINSSTKASCGANFVHNPNKSYGTLIDQDGNIYRTIIIGSQMWMAENLKASHYRNGDLIPIVTDGAIWSNLSSGATCWYNNDSSTYHCPYGKLYNWYAVADGRNLCPTGWHVPNDYDWNKLIKQLDPASDTTISGLQSLIAGGMLKSAGSQYWTSPNTNASNSSGFSALPYGDRNFSGPFYALNNVAYWWSSIEHDADFSRCHAINYSSEEAYRLLFDKNHGFSIRCGKD